MSELLGLVPVLASATLGLIWLGMGQGTPATRLLGVAVFVTAAWLQFWSPYALAGVLLQAALALRLEFWRRGQLG